MRNEIILFSLITLLIMTLATGCNSPKNEQEVPAVETVQESACDDISVEEVEAQPENSTKREEPEEQKPANENLTDGKESNFSPSQSACEHNFVAESEKSSSCTANGVRNYRCSKCGEEMQEKLPLFEHNYVEGQIVEPTCTQSGSKSFVCSNCGGSYCEKIAPLGHSFGGWSINEDCHLRTCTRCGQEEPSNHIWKNDTCEVCGAVDFR